jgi:hypothetical protein
MALACREPQNYRHLGIGNTLGLPKTDFYEVIRAIAGEQDQGLRKRGNAIQSQRAAGNWSDNGAEFRAKGRVEKR